MNERKKGLAMVCLGASLWGGSGVAGQYLLQGCGLTAGWLVVSRMLWAGLIFLGVDFFLYRKSLLDPWREGRDVREILMFALFGLVAVQYTYFACIREGNAAAATVLQYLMPVVIVGYTALKNRKIPRLLEILCVVMAVGGTFLLVTHGSPDTLSVPLAALAWGLSSALAAAMYTMLPKRLIRKWRPTLIIGWGMLAGGMVMSPFVPPWLIPGHWDMTALLIYAYVIIFGTVTAFGCYLRAGHGPALFFEKSLFYSFIIRRVFGIMAKGDA